MTEIVVTSVSGMNATGTYTNDNTPTITGTAAPNANIVVTMPGTNEVLTTTADASGVWSVTATQALNDYRWNKVKIKATEPDGTVVEKNHYVSVDTKASNNGDAANTEILNGDVITSASKGTHLQVKVVLIPYSENIPHGIQPGETVEFKLSHDGTLVSTTNHVLTHDDIRNREITQNLDYPAGATTGELRVDVVIIDRANNKTPINATIHDGWDKATLNLTPPKPIKILRNKTTKKFVRSNGKFSGNIV